MNCTTAFATTLCVAIIAASPRAMSAAEPTWRPYIVVSAEVDDAESSQALLEVGSAIGAGGWIRASAGQATLAETSGTIETNLLKLTGGLSIKAIDMSAGFVHRSDGAGFEQQDASVGLGWQGSRAAIGLDVFLREAESETVTSVQRRRRNPREVRITESIDGTGYGLHADFDVTPSLTLFASWMMYDYDIATNHPLLARFSLLNGSGITRSEAFLDTSINAGMTRHFQRASLTAQYMHDEALVPDDVTNSLQLSLQIVLGEHWTMTPMIGTSENELLGSAVFGGLALGYNW